MKDIAECGNPLYWHNCYSGTYDLIHGDSMAHPAKMSPALCYRILRHLKELGLLKDEDTVLDPMAGTGITNICAGAMGYGSVSVELEDKFVGFQQRNKEYAERRLYKALDWQMIKGDSRRLSELLGRDGLKSVTSPPYVIDNKNVCHTKDGKTLAEYDERRGYKPTTHPSTDYGKTEGQIGNLRDTPLKSVMSPPYGETQEGGGLAKDPPETFRGVLKEFTQSQGEEEGNIGNLKDTPLKAITSPPYGEAISAGKTGIDFTKCAGGRDRTKEPAYNPDANNPTSTARYSEDEDNIGNLPDKPLKSVMSPPYDNARSTKGDLAEDEYDKDRDLKNKAGRGAFRGRYGDTPGQIGALKSVMSPPYEDAKGDKHHSPRADVLAEEKALHETYTERGADNVGNEKGESYLEAMLQVYREIALVSDVLAVVIKNPTRGGKLRRLDLDTIKILEMAGWKIHCQHRSLLFEELEQADLFEGSRKRVKGRLSFFKRLSWQAGQPVASWEDILIAVRT